MIKRIEHCQDCDGDEDCELTDKEIFEGLNYVFQEGMAANVEDEELYHNVDEAMDVILEDPLEVSVRSGWHEPGGDTKPDEYRILLCTGGPAVQITGKINGHGQPDDANLQYQDWFTPWCNYPTTSEEDEALLAYARKFWFGE